MFNLSVYCIKVPGKLKVKRDFGRVILSLNWCRKFKMADLPNLF